MLTSLLAEQHRSYTRPSQLPLTRGIAHQRCVIRAEDDHVARSRRRAHDRVDGDEIPGGVEQDAAKGQEDNLLELAEDVERLVLLTYPDAACRSYGGGACQFNTSPH